MKNIRIALVVNHKETGEEVFTRFVKPDRLMNELAVIQDNKAWVVSETYVANSYGVRVSE